MPFRQLSPSLSQWTVQALTRLTATYAIAQGAGIVIGGRHRWGSPALRLALSVPGAPASWGIVLFLFGGVALALTFARHPKLVVWPMLAIASWSFFFALALAPSIIQAGSHVATTGAPTYAFVAVTACVLGIAYRRSAT